MVSIRILQYHSIERAKLIISLATEAYVSPLFRQVPSGKLSVRPRNSRVV
jgi:hypothetical protein